uniref:Protein MEI2-like 7 n=1 Tax=Nicotiana tabacum TaxID=4097 RepID=A0A1S3X0D9_TOBAC|nr:PREDICTED: protein MEI2-like 7 [Nicotiana tabacum]
MAGRRSLLNPQAPEYTPVFYTNTVNNPTPSLPLNSYHFPTGYMPSPFTPINQLSQSPFSVPPSHYPATSLYTPPPPPPLPPPPPSFPAVDPPPQVVSNSLYTHPPSFPTVDAPPQEVVPISFTSDSPTHYLPNSLYTSPPPSPAVDPQLLEISRPSVRHAPRNIPPRLMARENSRPRLPRMRSGYVPRQRGRGFSRGSCSNDGFMQRKMENERSQGVCCGKWPQNNKLQKHDVIPLTWSQNNTTTVMIKNIPYSYSRDMLMQFLDQHCSVENVKANDSNGPNIISAYDFLYLPMDFKNKRSRGFAFVNFTDHGAVLNFFDAFANKLNVFPGFPRSVKIVAAKIQGKEALVNRFKDTMFDCESEGFLPVIFSPPRDGSGELVNMITVGKCRVTSPSNSRSR